MSEVVVAVFDTAAQADRAEQDLEKAVERSTIHRYRPGDAGTPGAPHVANEATGDRIAGYDSERANAGYQNESGGGFWSKLFGSETHKDRSMYEAHVSEGRVVLSASCATEAEATRIIDLLAAHTNPGKIETKRTSEPVASAPSGRIPPETAETTTTRTGETAGNAEAGAPAPASTTPAKSEEVLSLSEEQLAVGKRAVSGGTTRVRRYVVERPVSEQVTLRDETVSVERRRPVSGTEVQPGAAAFEERTIEVSEQHEEPVVGKTAKVVEEVVIQKDVTERVETVKDTVRRDEVEVQNINSGEPNLSTETTKQTGRP